MSENTLFGMCKRCGSKTQIFDVSPTENKEICMGCGETYLNFLSDGEWKTGEIIKSKGVLLVTDRGCVLMKSIDKDLTYDEYMDYAEKLKRVYSNSKSSYLSMINNDGKTLEILVGDENFVTRTIQTPGKESYKVDSTVIRNYLERTGQE